jgi:Tfp pilus assembly protein PilN
MVLSVSGYARSQAAVADYVLRLEELGLFRQVQLLQTTQLSTTDGTVVSFNLSCPLRGVVEDPS